MYLSDIQNTDSLAQSSLPGKRAGNPSFLRLWRGRMGQGSFPDFF